MRQKKDCMHDIFQRKGARIIQTIPKGGVKETIEKQK